MNPRAVKVEYKPKYNLLVTFANNEARQFDFTDYLIYPVYHPLKEEAFCKEVRVVNGILQWNDEIDFSPDTVYLESKPVNH